MLPDKAVEEFRQIYKKKFGVLLSKEKAKLKAENFLRLFKLIARQIENKGEKS